MQRHPVETRRNRSLQRFAGIFLFTALVLLLAYALTGFPQEKNIWFVSETEQKTYSDPEIFRLDTNAAQHKTESASGKESAGSEAQWQLLLVNAQCPMPQDYEIALTELANGQAVDCRIESDLEAMLNACRAAGFSPLVCSSYRDEAYQRALYEKKVEEFAAKGLSAGEAETAAAQIVAYPGTSEHQTGLAVDIVDLNYQLLDEAQEDTPVQQWLLENSWRYGFILRYPDAHSGCTGITYEPWHYRYVGLDAAKLIYEQGLCLEEYLAQLP